MKFNYVGELLDFLKTQTIAIYGSGYVAKRFYDSLKTKGISKNVSCFVTTEGSRQCIDKKNIVSISNFINTSDTIICIAVHEVLRDEIISILENNGLYNYVWIYPFQFELMLGEPIKKMVNVPLKVIMETCFNDYRMAIRYLAMDQYYNKNDFGYELYLRTEGLHCNEETVRRRLDQFIGVIKKWEVNGYDKTKTVSILQNFEIVDGTHRVSVASYFEQNYIMCNVFATLKPLSELYSQNLILTKKSLVDAGIPNDVMELLDSTNNRIKTQYN